MSEDYSLKVRGRFSSQWNGRGILNFTNLNLRILLCYFSIQDYTKQVMSTMEIDDMDCLKWRIKRLRWDNSTFSQLGLASIGIPNGYMQSDKWGSHWASLATLVSSESFSFISCFIHVFRTNCYKTARHNIYSFPLRCLDDTIPNDKDTSVCI